jgi:4-hydroxybenzoyl-CoA thioesterase
MFTYERPVRFEDVDAARIVFFSRFLNYCHEAMEALFVDLAGGYVGLIVERHVGLPAVHVECDFTSPLRYGDVARIDVTVDRVGRSSCAFRYLRELRSIPIPDDMRVVLSRHLAPPPERPRPRD